MSDTPRSDSLMRLAESFAPNDVVISISVFLDLERELAHANSLEGRSCREEGCENLAQWCDGHAEQKGEYESGYAHGLKDSEAERKALQTEHGKVVLQMAREYDALQAKYDNLEGATNHAEGTPLSKAQAALEQERKQHADSSYELYAKARRATETSEAWRVEAERLQKLLDQERERYLLLSAQHARLCDQVYEEDGETLKIEAERKARELSETVRDLLRERAEKAEAECRRIETLHTGLMQEADRRYEQLEAECAALRKDADRYRWLREHDQGGDVVVNWNIGHDWVSVESLDDSIDAALAERRKMAESELHKRQRALAIRAAKLRAHGFTTLEIAAVLPCRPEQVKARVELGARLMKRSKP